MTRRPVGRPFSYRPIIKALEDNQLYTPASIARSAKGNGLVELARKTEEDEEKLLLRRVRISLGRFSNTNNFPDDGDGMVTIKGQAPTPGWFGWRWKAALKR